MAEDFNFEAKIYDYVWGSKDYHPEVLALDRIFKKFSVKDILDAGCGTGNHAILLGELGYNVIGVDISEEMVKRAKGKNKWENVKFFVEDIRELNFREEFDATICLGVTIAHMVTDRDMDMFFASIYNALRSEGIFIFNAKNAKRIDESLLNKLRPGEYVNVEDLRIMSLDFVSRDKENPNVLIWEPIWFIKEGSTVDFIRRKIKLRWFYKDEIMSFIKKHNFRVIEVLGDSLTGDTFDETIHSEMYFVLQKSNKV